MELLTDEQEVIILNEDEDTQENQLDDKNLVASNNLTTEKSLTVTPNLLSN